jgi:putative ABC transport system ATP-binding protein
LPRESVIDNVVVPLYYSDVPRRSWQHRAEKAIEAVGLTHRTHAEAYTLSGGERQRVAIARALINDPSVIFADEPTGNLDSKAGHAIMDILSAQHTAGHTVILITHDEPLSHYAHRVLTIHDGRLAADTGKGAGQVTA